VNFNYANRTTSPITLYTSLIQEREQTGYEDEDQLKLLHTGRHYKVEFSLMQETLICVAADNTARYHVYRFGQFLWDEAVSRYLLKHGNEARPTADYESRTYSSSKQDRRIDVCEGTSVLYLQQCRHINLVIYRI